MVGLGRFELPTSHLSGARSNQLSYRPARLEPGISRCTTLGLSKPNSTQTMSSNSSLAERPPIERVTGYPGFRRYSQGLVTKILSPMFTKGCSARARLLEVEHEARTWRRKSAGCCLLCSPQRFLTATDRSAGSDRHAIPDEAGISKRPFANPKRLPGCGPPLRDRCSRPAPSMRLPDSACGPGFS
jgi:hypothetical protein